MQMNIGRLDQVIRLFLGMLLVGLTLAEIIGAWGWIGLVPLATGLLRFCPAYSILGVQTCPLHEQVYQDK